MATFNEIVTKLQNLKNNLTTTKNDLKSELQQIGCDVADTDGLGEMIDGLGTCIGDLSQLETNNKNTIVDAINELFISRGEIDQVIEESVNEIVNERIDEATKGKYYVEGYEKMPSWYIPPLSINDSWAPMSVSTMPTARGEVDGGMINNKIYCIGGKSGSTSYNKNECFDTVTKSWSTKANISSARYSTVVAEYDNVLHIISGYNGSSSLTTHQCYDPSTNTYTDKAALPAGRWHATGGRYLNGIMVCGGYGSSSSYATVYFYNPLTNAWSTRASMPDSEQDACSCEFNGDFYVLNIAGDCYSYNYSANKWTDNYIYPNTPYSANYGSELIPFNNRIYSFGGSNGYSTYTDVTCFNPTNWYNGQKAKAPMPEARTRFIAERIGNVVYVIGGELGESTGSTSGTWTSKGEVFIYFLE